ncbi:MAG: TonB-dependent receptor [Candidatus Thiodiazotropha sp.]|jgi:iron complex outermembrane receptor protein
MRYNLRRTLLSSSLLVLSSPLIALDEDASIFGDVETVSIATGMERPIITAPAVASVFDAKYIRDSGARDLTDILNMVPGIHVGVSTINYAPIYSTRGFSSTANKNILIMIDGIPKDELLFGYKILALGKVPIDIIDRVEVSRGPGSALWGADAFSAVVNIITKTKVPEDSSITISGGSYNTRNVRMFTGTNMENFDITTAFEHSKTDGHEPTIFRDKQTLLDEQLGTDASLAPGKASTDTEGAGMQINLSDEHSQLGIRAYHTNLGMGIGMTAALDPYGDIESEGIEAWYKYSDSITQDIGISSTLSYSQSNQTSENLHFFPPGAFFVFPDGVILNEENRQSFARLNTALRYSGADKHFLTLGLGGESAKIKSVDESRNYDASNGLLVPIDMHDTLSDPVLGEKEFTRNLMFTYLQDEWTLDPDWNFTFGIRYDDYRDFGTVTTQRAVLQWNTTYAMTTKLLYGRGYRTLSFLSTQSRNIPAIEGNPELKPEKFDQIQLAFDYRPRPYINLRLDIFYHKTIDQIRQKSAEGLGIRAENSGDQTGRGMEVEIWWDINTRTKLYSFYAYQDNTEKALNEDTGYAPHHKIFGLIQHERPSGWFFNSKVTYVGSRDRIPNDDRPDAETYAFVDILMRKELSKQFEVSLEIRNIFNEDAEEASFGVAFPGDMPLPGRNYYLMLSSRF